MPVAWGLRAAFRQVPTTLPFSSLSPGSTPSSRSGITYSAALSAVPVTTSVTAVVLCGIAVDLPLA